MDPRRDCGLHQKEFLMIKMAHLRIHSGLGKTAATMQKKSCSFSKQGSKPNL
jgi:hypothetical protein